MMMRVITKLADIEILMNTGSEGSDHRFDFRISVDPVESCLLHVQDLSAKRKYRLGRTASRGLRRATCRVSLYDVDLAVFRIFVRTVSQFSWKRHAVQGRFSPGELSGLPRCLPGTLGHDRFLQDDLCHLRMLLQINRELLCHQVVNGSARFAVSKLLLGLTLKLGLLELDADDSSQTLTDILAGKAVRLFDELIGLGIGVKSLCQGVTETGKMCSALRGGDVVYKAVNTLVVTVVVLKGNLHRNAVHCFPHSRRSPDKGESFRGLSSSQTP